MLQRVGFGQIIWLVHSDTCFLLAEEEYLLGFLVQYSMYKLNHPNENLSADLPTSGNSDCGRCRGVVVMVKCKSSVSVFFLRSKIFIRSTSVKTGRGPKNN